MDIPSAERRSPAARVNLIRRDNESDPCTSEERSRYQWTIAASRRQQRRLAAAVAQFLCLLCVAARRSWRRFSGFPARRHSRALVHRHVENEEERSAESFIAALSFMLSRFPAPRILPQHFRSECRSMRSDRRGWGAAVFAWKRRNSRYDLCIADFTAYSEFASGESVAAAPPQAFEKHKFARCVPIVIIIIHDDNAATRNLPRQIAVTRVIIMFKVTAWVVLRKKKKKKKGITVLMIVL